MKWMKRNWKKIGLLAVAFVMMTFLMPSEATAAETVTVKYNMTGLNIPEVTFEYEVGELITILDAPSERAADKYFSTWVVYNESEIAGTYKPGVPYQVTDDVTFEIQWVDDFSEDYYTLTYALMEEMAVGDLPGVVTYNDGEDFYVTKETPSLDEHTFLYWENLVTGDKYYAGDIGTIDGESILLVAAWDYTPVVSAYTVNYIMTGLEDQIANYEITDCEYGSEIILLEAPSIYPEGYYFYGWGYDPDDDVENTQVYKPGATFEMPEQDVTFYIIWVLDNTELSTVSYDLGEELAVGEVPCPVCYDLGETFYVTAVIPTLDEYEFTGWKDEYSGEYYETGKGYEMPAYDVVLTAQWEPVDDATDTTDDTDATPKTGDDSNMMMWFVLVMGACVGIGVFSKKMRRN